MRKEAEAHRDRMIKSVIGTAAALIFITTGRSITIPVIDLPLSEIPAAVELLTFMCSISLLFLATAMLNWHGYSAIISQFNIRKAKADKLDPDFIGAADLPFEFVTKVFQHKLSIYEADDFEPGAAYIWTGRLVLFTMVICTVGFLAFPFTAVWFGLASTYTRDVLGWVFYLYAPLIGTANVCAVVLFVIVTTSFRFRMVAPLSEATPPARA